MLGKHDVVKILLAIRHCSEISLDLRKYARRNFGRKIRYRDDQRRNNLHNREIVFLCDFPFFAHVSTTFCIKIL